MKKFWTIALFTAALSFATAAFALDLSEARSRGLIGEKLDGFVEVIKQSAEAQALADQVNTRRLTEYQRISKDNGQPVSVVSKVAAENIINNLPAGSYYRLPNGEWARKK